MKKISYTLLFTATALFASNTFFENNKEGYFYYKDPKPLKKKKNEKEEESQSKVVSTTDYNSTMTKMNIPFENESGREYRRKKEKEYMENIPWSDLDNLSADEYRRMLDTTREISVATPSKQYVKIYAALQKFWVDKSEKFAKVWQVANLENPDELIYSDNSETSAAGRKIRNKKQKQEKQEFFEKIKNRAGYIVVIDGEKDSENYRSVKNVFEFVKNKTGLDYKIVDFYSVPTLARKLKLDIKGLPDVFMLYMGNQDKEVYKRVARGYSTADQIMDNTKFVFENGILEKNKKPEDRIEKK